MLLALQVLSGRPWSLPFPMLRLRVSGSTPGGIFALGLTAGVASSCCAPVLAGVVALSALASSVTGALGLGLAYVFGMVFPLLVAVLVWDRVHPGSPVLALRTRRIRLRGWSLPWTDAIAAAMFLIIGILALLIAYTGQSTYLPGWLEEWNQWATGLAGDVSVYHPSPRPSSRYRDSLGAARRRHLARNPSHGCVAGAAAAGGLQRLSRGDATIGL